MIIADLQIHSPYARACSKHITFENLEKFARIKGVNLLGVGDFQHPAWRKEIDKNLQEDENGILWTKTKFPFLWQTEVSLMYFQDGKRRAVHHLIFSPNREVADQITEALAKGGDLNSDGRPTLNFTSPELVELMMEINKDIEIIPAHSWTSWFGIFGSKSGFDSLKECFGEKAKYVHAIETGMSSDIIMNRRISFLDNVSLVSFSDAHSMWPWRIGREATIFDCDLTYKSIIKAIRTKKGLYGTIETVPDYGRYHYDGHRKCNVILSPEEAERLKNICPVCGKELTIGVLHRVNRLADRKNIELSNKDPKFFRLVPLTELISAYLKTSDLNSKEVWKIYNLLIEKFGNEYNVLIKVEFDKISEVVGEKLAKIIIDNRQDRLKILPGYDGVYGKIIIDEEWTFPKRKQRNLFDF